MKSTLRNYRSEDILKIQRSKNTSTQKGDDKEDSGASIVMGRNNENQNLNIDFGYTGSKNSFRRNLDIGIPEVIEMKNYLDNYLVKSSTKDMYVIFHDPYYNSDKIVDHFELEMIGNIELPGYKLGHLKLKEAPHVKFTSLEIDRQAEVSVYVQLYKTNELIKYRLLDFFFANRLLVGDTKFSLNPINLNHNNQVVAAHYFSIDFQFNTTSKIEIVDRLTISDLDIINSDAEKRNYPISYINKLRASS
jgi:hypothetical protein